MSTTDGAAVLASFDGRYLDGLKSWGKANEFNPNCESTGKPEFDPWCKCCL